MENITEEGSINLVQYHKHHESFDEAVVLNKNKSARKNSSIGEVSPEQATLNYQSDT